MDRTWVVAVPACNEADYIEGCLRALADQETDRGGHVVVMVNNSTDDTAAICRDCRFPPSITPHIVTVTLPPASANAGTARRLAMTHASAIAGPNGVLLTTDADGLVDPNWVTANLACVDAGADAVAGWAELFPSDWSRIPARLHEDDAKECAYDALCDEIEAILDPDPADPHPRHTQHAGASIAVTAEAYLRCGGVPNVVCGEDRALVAALRRFDARIRHAPEVRVQVSGRITGRCQGGMADTIRRRLTAPDAFIDDRLEPAALCALRAGFRAEVRKSFFAASPPAADLADRLEVPRELLVKCLKLPFFGMAWHEVETASARLRRQMVAVRDLASETAVAAALLTKLRRDGIAGKTDLVKQF